MIDISDRGVVTYEGAYMVETYPDGERWWYLNGLLHRDGGPAIEWSDGTRSWYQKGELHREDGHAIEYIDDTGYYFLNNEKIEATSTDEFIRLVNIRAFL